MTQPKRIETGNKDIGDIFNQLNILSSALKKAQDSGEIRETELMSIAGMFYKVLEHLTVKHEVIRKEVMENMGGTVLDYPTKTAYNEGQEKISEVYAWLDEQGRDDDRRRAYKDAEFRKQLVEEFNSITM